MSHRSRVPSPTIICRGTSIPTRDPVSTPITTQTCTPAPGLAFDPLTIAVKFYLSATQQCTSFCTLAPQARSAVPLTAHFDLGLSEDRTQVPLPNTFVAVEGFVTLFDVNDGPLDTKHLLYIC